MSLFSRKSSVDVAERRTQEARRQMHDVLERLHDAIDKYEEQTEEVSHARNGSSSNSGRTENVAERGDREIGDTRGSN